MKRLWFERYDYGAGWPFIKKTGLLVCLCLMGIIAVQAQPLWQPNSTTTSADGKYQVYTVDVARWSRPLEAAPLEADDAMPGIPLSIPDPDGQLVEFYCKETQLLRVTSGIDTRNIHTYTGYNKNRTATLHLTIYPGKVYGIVMEQGTAWYISTTTGNASDIAVFDAAGNPDKNIPVVTNNDVEEDFNLDDIVPDNGIQLKPTLTPSVNCNLKTFRLAMGCTAEYTAANGSRAATLANFTAMVNAVNTIYERELGIRLLLVTNDSLMPMDSTTDLFDNDLSLGGTSCGQNANSQNSFNAYLDSTDYDLGITLFYANHGGCANIAVACNKSNKGKAMAGNGTTDPTSSLFRTIAHEVGHLLSAGHSHNSNGPNCFFSSSTAWEPGGGSALMAYTGCQPSFTSLNTSIYFHAGNIEKIRNYTTTGAGSCAVTSPAGTSPMITTATDDTFFIPVSTPYRLYTDATDAEDNNLLYSFDQMDLGTGSTVLPSDTTSFGPMVRLVDPSLKPYRYIPRIDSLLVNNYPHFESLPSIERNLTFWALVRDNHPGCGCLSVDTIRIRTKGTQAFTVTSQSAPLTVSTGSTLNVTWNVAGTDQPPFNVAQVRILFAADGLNYNTVLASGVPNSGSATVSIPNMAAVKGRIMVAAINNIFFNINTANIKVEAPCTTAQYSNIWPEADVTALQGDAALNLDLFPSFGQPVDTLAGVMTATGPTGVIGYKANASDTTSCYVGNGFSGHYQSFPFQVVKPGIYTASCTFYTLTGSSIVLSLYNASGFTATAAMACNNYLHRSSAYNTSGGLGYDNSFSFPALADNNYNLAVLKPFSSNVGTYGVNFSGPGRIFTEFQNPASAYGYLVVDSTGTILYGGTVPPDLQSNGPGIYTVYGVSHVPSINLSDYQNQAFNGGFFTNFDTSRCALISANNIKVNILPNKPLPLDYIKLEATTKGSNVQLDWTCPETTTASRLSVERSADGTTFETLASFSSKEYKTVGNSYRYWDQAPLSGRNFYRIRKIGTSNNSLYSNIKSVMFYGSGTPSIAMLPNPATSKVLLRISGFSFPLQLALCDMTSRVIARYAITNNNYTIDLSTLMPGMYILKGEGFAGKLIKQ